MDTNGYLRRQAETCLRLSQFCSDPTVIQHLRVMAAEFHTRALRAEFESEFDADDDDPPARPDRRH
jgi:hypothetical protein